MTVLVTLLTVAVAILTLLVVGLLRSHATILRRLHELGAGIEEVPVGDPAAPRTAPDTVAPSTAPAGRQGYDLQGVTPDGETRALRVSGSGRDTILAFLSSGCATCLTFWEQLGDPELPDRTRLVVVTKGPEDESPAEVASLAPPGVTVVMSSDAWTQYEVPGSPYVIHVEGHGGTVSGEGTGADWHQVRRMLLQAAGDRGATGRSKAAADARREQEIDRTLLAAGVTPGDPSLYKNAQQLTEDHGETT